MSTVPTAPAPRYYTFWSINGPLQRDRLRQQLVDFKAAGLHGVVFHPRFYPGIPPYLSADYLAHVNDTILYAKELGLRFWLYDENGWPSGTGDGQVLANYPDSGAMRLDLTPTATPDSIGSFSVDADNRIVSANTAGAKTWHLTPTKSTTSTRSIRACSDTFSNSFTRNTAPGSIPRRGITSRRFSSTNPSRA